MNNPTELAERYVAAWNERDASRRRELIAKTWIEGGVYVDPHRSGAGHDEICAMMQKVHDAFPPPYRFRLKSGVETHNGNMRFQWEAGGTKDAPLHFVGTDFGVVDDDERFKSVTGFVDEAPPAK